MMLECESEMVCIFGQAIVFHLFCKVFYDLS